MFNGIAIRLRWITWRALAASFVCATALAFAGPARAQDIFSDGFEDGTPCTWSAVETPELCFDGIDNDCDGAIDLVDPECADTLCEPCATGDDCLGPTDLCLELDDGLYCGKDCSADNPYGTPANQCPAGYSCYDPGGMYPTQCVPVTNACLCDGTNLALRLACTISVPGATCDGERSCTVSGWSECVVPDEEGELCADGIDNDCDGAIDCDDAGCDGTPPCLLDGEPCTASGDCVSGHCQNGFCCASGDCCAASDDCPPAYTLPPTCTSPASCQGYRYEGACIANTCFVTPVADDTGCGPTTLADDCGLYVDEFCDGTEDQTAPVCLTSCQYDIQCDPIAACQSEVCVALSSNGEACWSSWDCASNHCVDGVCCDSACDGLCMGCTSTLTGGSDGTCGFIPAGLDPDAECGENCCDGTGMCDTSGACP
jgi:hypothetical protein